MDKWVVLTEYNWAFWIAGAFALFEFFKWAYTGIEWLYKTFGFETKGMRKRREEWHAWDKRLTDTEKAIKDIKKNSERNVEMFLDHERQVVEKFTGIKREIIEELNKLHDKIDAQKAEMSETNEANKKTDCAILRDRILGGMRHFGRNKDEHGCVHVSITDYENLDALFKEYFAKGGNGVVQKIYEEEFIHFTIDR